MARPKNPSPPLKSKLAKVARRIVRKDGVDALTMRAAAEAADVSPNAPAIHYPGGAAELLAEVAVGGFKDLRGAMSRDPVAPDPVERIRALVERYVEFGVREEELYRAMFHSRLIPGLTALSAGDERAGTFAQLGELKELTYQDLIAPLYDLRARGTLRGDDPREAPGLALAALAHGLVGEFIDEGLVHPGEGADPWSESRRAMALEMTDVLLLGLLADVAPSRSDAMEQGHAPLGPADDPSWGLYFQTILQFFPGEGAITIDLREPVSEGSPEELFNRGLPGRFAVLTGCNPRGRRVTDNENAQLERALKERLRTEGQMWVPVDGVSPDGRHRESGVAVAMTRDDARRLAIEFEQSAIYWFDGTRFWVVGALANSAATPLPVTQK